MFEFLQSTDSLIWTIARQSSAFLALGLAASLVLRNRPARAHWVLLAATLAALVSPALTETSRRLGWGLWDSPASATGAWAGSTSTLTFGEEDRGLAPPARLVWDRAEPSGIEAPVARRAGAPSVSWRSAFLIGWATASFWLFARLVGSLVGGWRLARTAREVDDPAALAWATAAADGLGLRAAPTIKRLPTVSCPAVWCWGRRPALLLPEGCENAAAIDWVGVFRHELAHWSRRDHISALLGEILVCALPWQPLAWWSRGRLAQLAELACDDWALAGGGSPADYAESLLALKPRRRSAALAAVSSRRGLTGRVRRILAEGRREPALGARWLLGVGLVLAVAVSALALARPRPLRADSPKVADQAAMKTLRGKVLAADGRPVAGARVVWAVRPLPPLPYSAMPRATSAQWSKIEAVAEARTGDGGAFELTGPFLGAEQLRRGDGFIGLLTTAPGFGMLAETVSLGDLDKELTLRVPEQMVIRGRLLQPDGAPAAGVRATLIEFRRGVKAQSVDWTGRADEVPDFWPRPQVTDADGRFTIEGAPEGMEAVVLLERPGFAVDTMRVTMYREAKPGNVVQVPEGEAMPVKPTFTHTLRPERFVVGRLTDAETGAPVSGMLVELRASHRRGGEPRRARTDADGRYRFGGQSSEGVYTIYAYPEPDSGYLPRAMQGARPAGGDALELEINLALKRGAPLRGRVVDRDDNQPIAGAAVAIRPQRPLGGGVAFGDAALTDTDGRFTITAEPGKNALAVETRSDIYMREPFDVTSPWVATVYPQGSLMVDVPKEGEPAPVEIGLRRGVPLEVRVVDPAGEPVESVTAMYQGVDAALFDAWNFGREFPAGRFRIPAVDPETTRRVFFVNVDRHLGAVADLKPNPTGEPIEVRLQPTATIRGKLVAARRELSYGSRLFVLSALLDPRRSEPAPADLWRSSAAQSYVRVLGPRQMDHNPDQAEQDGSFQIDALIPGVDYHLASNPLGERFAVTIKDLKPGEVRDLGTIEVK